jgi:hypothetical protein
MVRLAHALTGITAPKAKIAVYLAGTLPYFAGREALDLLGKTDRIVAHEEARPIPSGISPLVGFWPGHMKWDYAHSIGDERPDVVAQVWWLSAAEAEPYLQRDYQPATVDGFTVYLRRDSPYILWERVIAGRAVMVQ